MPQTRTVITGTGSFIPQNIKTNRDFVNQEFYGEDHAKIATPPLEIVDKFKDITGIEERRYADSGMNTSDMAAIAARRAIEDAGIETVEIRSVLTCECKRGVCVKCYGKNLATGYMTQMGDAVGNVLNNTIQTDVLPAIASRVKQSLGIRNPNCVAYDILFGCPGWIQGVIQADAYIKAGIAQKCLVIGAETLSRVIDIYDRDSMIFSDGAGATVIEAISSEETQSGILATSVQSHCVDEAFYLHFGKSNFPGADPDIRYMKMKGRKVYEYAIKNVPLAMKACLDKCGLQVTDVKKFFLHQANEKMDEGFIKALYKLYGLREVPGDIMPMSIHKYGNSSVATIPTLYDHVKHDQMEPHELEAGDIVMFASVGAGMNINAICYRV